MDDVGRAINVSQYYVHEGNVTATPPRASERTPVFRNISISNMNIIRCRAAVGYEPAPPVMINIEGLPEMPISGLRLSNVMASGKSGLKVHDTVGLQLHDVEVNADGGPTFLIRDSKDLELDGVSTRQPLAGVPVLRLERCPGAIVRASRAFSGTGTFLSTPLGELKDIVLQGNVLDSAQKPTEESAAPDAAQTQTLRNEKVSVTELTLAPGQIASWPADHADVVVYLDDGSIAAAPARERSAVQTKRGDAVFRPAQAGTLKNAGSSPLRMVWVQYLGGGNSQTWGAEGLAPDYKLLFENQYGRVYDIKMAAGKSEPQHTHHDRVVICLSGAELEHILPDGRKENSTLKTGEIAWRAGATHIGHNLGKTDLWVIAVEPK
jgi:hypothetical protein